MRDWTGSKKSIYTTLGASNHSETEREINDYYATDPDAINYLLEKATLNNNLWECACGEGHLSKRLVDLGYNVRSTDLIFRGYGTGGVDFLKTNETFDGDIITNPPYKYAAEFCSHCLEILPEGRSAFLFLKIQFLEGKGRRELFDRKQLKTVYVSSKRILCAKNGNFEEVRGGAVRRLLMRGLGS